MQRRGLGLWLLLFLMASPWVMAEPAVDTAQKKIRIALIIDDLGNQKVSGKQALALPGPITYAFLPQTPFAWQLASEAHSLNKEVMLHLPMESDFGNALGDGALTLDMSQADFLQTLKLNLASVPYVAGVNNHMGSLLTRDPTAMRWLMNGLREAGLYFIDSRTTDATVAETVARNQLIATARRHVFLDNVQDPSSVRTQLASLIELAREQGSAIGIGHPYPETLTVLAEELPKLKAAGIELVPASTLTHHGSELWHASSYPLHKDVKNSKPLPSPIY
ncbi:MAG: divergent polysaccharide deacetylase family protein [Candidatus Thiodiazotropha sp. (ex Myrtea spinifera)]|nr:divergent polysaccharide deacetylase family protein [Candidatus Thiodiazotropha sp. (ex Myrtea spinifera)]